MERKVLVFGAAGQVGRELVERPGDLAVGFNRADVDILDTAEVRHAISAYRPLAIVNAAAYTAVDRAETEQDEAYRANRDGAEVLAEAASSIRVPLIHLSTDYVFDGTKRAPYEENDAIAPLNAYGKSKADGEDAVRRRCVSHIILRASWVYSPYGTNFVRTMLRLAGNHKSLNVVNDQVGCPTSAADIASTIIAIVASAQMEGFARWGTYHFRGADVVTWYEFACRIFDLAATYGQEAPQLAPIGTADFPTPARRPNYSVLSASKLQRTFGIRPRPLSESLRECLDQLFE